MYTQRNELENKRMWVTMVHVERSPEVIAELVPSSESEVSEVKEATIHDINIFDISDNDWSIDSEEEC